MKLVGAALRSYGNLGTGEPLGPGGGGLLSAGSMYSATQVTQHQPESLVSIPPLERKKWTMVADSLN